MSGGGEQPAVEALWALARQRYEEGSDAVSAIADGLGLTAQALTSRARRLGWKLRGGTRTKLSGTRDTIQRLKSLLQQRLGELEAQIGALGEAATAASSERDIRAMNTLVRTLEKVLELERKDRAQRHKHRKIARDFDDAEREALADKLDAMRREVADEDHTEAPEPAPDAAAQP